MLLNLMRTEGANAEHMIRHSFHQFQSDRSLPDMHSTMSDLTKELDAITIDDEISVGEYYTIRQQLNKLKEQMRSFITKPENALPFLQPGRLVGPDCIFID
jgi:ATP-dependent RNA helicase DOB1